MSDKEVLKKAIEKAVENGMPLSVIDKGTFYATYILVKARGGNVIKKDMSDFQIEDCYGLLFSHSFAKAFWGEGRITGMDFDDFGSPTYHYSDGSYYKLPEWQFHLQLMVIEINPIDYLRNFMEDGE